MKPKEFLYLLGLRPKTRTYDFCDKSIELPQDGTIPYARWLHPKIHDYSLSQATVDELRRYLQLGDAAIDIGAHRGDTAIPMALAVGMTGTVLAFEPNSYVFPTLNRTTELVRAAGKGVIVPYNYAATPEDCEMEFAYSDPGFCNGGHHWGISPWLHTHAFKLKVQGRNIPKLVDQKHPGLSGKIRYLKTDTEGFDYMILRSMESLLRESKPYLRAEVYRWVKPNIREEFYHYLRGLGYRVHKMISTEKLCGPELEPKDMLRQRQFDIFCVPENAQTH